MNSILKIVLTMALVLPLFCGCDGGGDGEAPAVDVTGTWKGTSTFAGSTSSETLHLTQTSDGNVSGTDADGLNYSGEVSGNTLSLVASVSNGSDNLSLDVSGEVSGNTVVLSGKVKGTADGVNVDGPITFNLSR